MRPWFYAGVGLALAAAAPLGLLLFRLVPAAHLSLEDAWAEFQRNPRAVAYWTLSAAAVLAGAGFVLGRQLERFARLSTIDPLTGLANARAFDRRLHSELARALRYAQPLALLLIDVDRLKGINDAGGHAAGDRALRTVAAAIRHELRETDFAARRSGDEFAVIAPATAPPGGRFLADRIRRRLLSAQQDDAAVTASIGVSGWYPGMPEAFTPARLTEAADRALYEAKRNGRNTIEAA